MTTPNIAKYRGLLRPLPGANRFTELKSYREASLVTARECAQLTKPLAVPASGQPAGQAVLLPHQSHGARLVSNLVSQLLLILFPPGVPFFKLDLESVDVRELAKTLEIEEGKTMYDSLRETFVSLENNCSIQFETMGLREKIRMILLQLVVGGNSLYLRLDDDIELIPLADWVCSRDGSGELVEIVYKQFLPVTPELIKSLQLPEETQEAGVITTFTRCYRAGSQRWTVQKYLDASPEPYDTLEVNPGDFWVHVPVWELSPGEDYGRGPVEESLGDLRTYESGTLLVKESASALAKVVFAVRPNGMTKATDVAHAENTEIISGDPSDVGVIQANKVHDMSGFIQFLNNIKMELDFAFMMPNVIRRDAERVTAEEIRRMATELEKSRGGTYNNLSKNLQGPMATLLLAGILKGSSNLSKLKVGDLLPIINTGLQGLGRSLELESTLMFLNDIRLLPGMETLIDQHQMIYRLASLRGLEMTSVIKTPERMQEEAQANAIDTMAQQMGPSLMQGAMQPNE